jgi:AAA15 family ATPase/GTPase
MKKIFYTGLVGLIFMYGFTTFQTTDNCDKKGLTTSCKKKMEPFKYDSQKFTKIMYTKKTQQLEIEVPVFIGEKYRLVFNTSSLPKPILVNVYTKDKESKKREAIYTSKDVKPGENEIIFDVPRVRKLFVDYDVPADTTSQKISGCLVFMVGYK